MAKGLKGKLKAADLEDVIKTKPQHHSQRHPASCPRCGTNSGISISNSGNTLDCGNCQTVYTWS